MLISQLSLSSSLSQASLPQTSGLLTSNLMPPYLKPHASLPNLPTHLPYYYNEKNKTKRECIDK